MKILVDADACPVKTIITDIAKEYKIAVIMFCDTSHIIKDDYAAVVTVDKSSDSADFVLVNKIVPSDIVVSQDYGVAAMSLAKGAYVINQNGLVITNENIDSLLMQRHIVKQLKNSNGRVKGPSKRTIQNDEIFKNNFINLIKSAM